MCGVLRIITQPRLDSVFSNDASWTSSSNPKNSFREQQANRRQQKFAADCLYDLLDVRKLLRLVRRRRTHFLFLFILALLNKPETPACSLELIYATTHQCLACPIVPDPVHPPSFNTPIVRDVPLDGDLTRA